MAIYDRPSDDRPRDDRPRDDRPRDDRPRDDRSQPTPKWSLVEATEWSLESILGQPEPVETGMGDFKWSSSYRAPVSLNGKLAWISVVELGASGCTKETWIIQSRGTETWAIGSKGICWDWMKEGAQIPALRKLDQKEKRELLKKLGRLSSPFDMVTDLPGFRDPVTDTEPPAHGWYSKSLVALPANRPEWAFGADAWRLQEGMYLVFPPDTQDGATRGSTRLVPKDDLKRAYSKILREPDYRQGDLLIYSGYFHASSIEAYLGKPFTPGLLYPEEPDETPDETRNWRPRKVRATPGMSVEGHRAPWDLKNLLEQEAAIGDHRISFDWKDPDKDPTRFDGHEWDRVRISRGRDWIHFRILPEEGTDNGMHFKVTHPQHREIELMGFTSVLFVRAPGSSDPFPKRGASRGHD